MHRCLAFSPVNYESQSVLQQTAATTIPTANDNTLLSINSLPAIVEQINVDPYEPNANFEVATVEDIGGDGQDAQLLVGTKRPNTHLSLPQQLVKKQGVSGESCDTARQQVTDISIQKYDKDFR